MKKALLKLEEIRSNVESTKTGRNSYFKNQSDDWKNSQKADRHTEETNILDHVINSLDSAIEDLKIFIQN